MDDWLPGSADQAVYAIRVEQKTFRHACTSWYEPYWRQNETEFVMIAKKTTHVKSAKCQNVSSDTYFYLEITVLYVVLHKSLRCNPFFCV